MLAPDPVGRPVARADPQIRLRVSSRRWSAYAARMTSHESIQRQLDAYNAHDVDAFLACYADDVVVRHGDGRVLMTGRDAMRAVYERLFTEHPDVHVEVPTRLAAGDWIVDEEHVSVGGGEMRALVGYGIHDGVIRHVVMLASDM